MKDNRTGMILLSVALSAFFFTCVASAWDGDLIDEDETVIFFPSFGYFNSNSNKWTLLIQGHILEVNTSKVMRRVVTSGFEAYTGSTVQDEENFWLRIRPFISDNERREKVRIRLGEKTYSMPESSDGGRFTGEISLTNSEARQLMDSTGWITYNAISEDNRAFQGKVQLIQSEGISIISDIDDTIKITEVYKGKKTMLVNTFNRPMTAAPQMAAFYRKLHNTAVRFHYLSGSPWQLFPALNEFMAANDFPAGSVNMKAFRANPASSEFWDFIAEGTTRELKQHVIKDLMVKYPKREFILIGDSGEHDPEIYGWAAMRYPNQVKEIYIRNVTLESLGNERIKSAFRNAIGKVKLIDMNSGSIIE